MIEMSPRVRVPASRFPAVPFTHRRPAPDLVARRLIRQVLSAGPLRLPTDVPDLSPLFATGASIGVAGERAA
jgi:hypothetical protein